MQFTLPAADGQIHEYGITQVDPQGLLERLQQRSDRRGERGKRDELAPLLLLIVFAKLAGEDTPSGIADWVANRAHDLLSALHLDWPRMPHPNTLRRILALVIQPEELDRVVAEHLRSLPQVGPSRLVAIDGKTARGTISEADPRGTHLLAAYLPHEGIVLGQVSVGPKENEIVEAPRLVEHLDLHEKIVVGEAMQAQRALSEQITQASGDFIWVIKENQPRVRTEVSALFAPQSPAVLGNVLPTDFACYEQATKGHGRWERRRMTVSSALKGYTAWPSLEQARASLLLGTAADPTQDGQRGDGGRLWGDEFE